MGAQIAGKRGVSKKANRQVVTTEQLKLSAPTAEKSQRKPQSALSIGIGFPP